MNNISARKLMCKLYWNLSALPGTLVPVDIISIIERSAMNKKNDSLNLFRLDRNKINDKHLLYWRQARLTKL